MKALIYFLPKKKKKFKPGLPAYVMFNVYVYCVEVSIGGIYDRKRDPVQSTLKTENICAYPYR